MGEVCVLVEGPAWAEEVDVVWETGGGGAVREEARAYIDERWAGYLADAEASGRSLFNSPITWLVGAARDEAGRIILTLGETDYKTFVVTVLRDRGWFEARAPKAMRPALGNSVLLTYGERALLGIRSVRTSAYGGRAHLIGGVLDLLGTNGLERNAQGLITHLRREMAEEADIGDADLAGPPMLLAVGRDHFLGQPELIWRWELNVNIEHVAKRLDATEHSGSIIIEKANVSPQTYDQMTPVARAAWERWRG